MEKEKKVYALSPAAQERKDKYIRKYQQEHYTCYCIRCSNKDDADIIEKLKDKKNKSDFIKNCIRRG